MLSIQMHYGESVSRRVVPLALGGLISASNLRPPILDILSKDGHDNDVAVALNSIFAMGLVGAETNDARLAQMLRLPLQRARLPLHSPSSSRTRTHGQRNPFGKPILL